MSVLISITVNIDRCNPHTQMLSGVSNDFFKSERGPKTNKKPTELNNSLNWIMSVNKINKYIKHSLKSILLFIHWVRKPNAENTTAGWTLRAPFSKETLWLELCPNSWLSHLPRPQLAGLGGSLWRAKGKRGKQKGSVTCQRPYLQSSPTPCEVLFINQFASTHCWGQL